MTIFYFINGYAGRFAGLDAIMRIIYVSAVPALGTMLVAWIIGAPRAWMLPKAPRRKYLFLASFIAVSLGIASVWGVRFFEQLALGGIPLSRRPFLTHFVTSLVMEPNNNGFPSFEVMFAAICATLLWAGRPRLGIVGWVITFFLSVARLYCGSNYTLDVGIGLLWGLGLATLALAICGISLPFPLTRQRHLRWSSGFQAVASILLLVGVLSYIVGPLSLSPRHFPALSAWIYNSKSSAAGDEDSNDPAPKQREMLLLTDVVRQDGHLPAAETFLYHALAQQKIGVHLLGINVAELNTGKIAYRYAAIRFEVPGSGQKERQHVAYLAMRLLKAAFHADDRLNHIDILGMKMDVPNSIYTEGGTPVFTASLDRSSLVLSGDKTWLNAPNVDPGLWLRARSLLYFDSQILPSDEAFPAKTFLQKGHP